MGRIIDDDDFDEQLARTLAAAMFGGADLGEAVATAGRITPGDFDSWHREWTATATVAEDDARSSAAGGHRVSAAQAYLRASEYHRQAFFYGHNSAKEQPDRISHGAPSGAKCVTTSDLSGDDQGE